MENFLGMLKVEMYYRKKFESPQGFIEKLEEYVHYYNNERISLNLKGMSSVQYRAHSHAILYLILSKLFGSTYVSPFLNFIISQGQDTSMHPLCS